MHNPLPHPPPHPLLPAQAKIDLSSLCPRDKAAATLAIGHGEGASTLKFYQTTKKIGVWWSGRQEEEGRTRKRERGRRRRRRRRRRGGGGGGRGKEEEDKEKKEEEREKFGL